MLTQSDNKVMRSWRLRADLVEKLEAASQGTGISQTRLIEDALDHLFAEPWLAAAAQERGRFLGDNPKLAEVLRKKMKQSRSRFRENTSHGHNATK